MLDAYIQAAMYPEGICGLRILKYSECRVVIENMYFALREPSDAVTMTFDANVDANRFLLLAGKEARYQVILIENCLITCISARDLRHGGDRQVRVGMRVVEVWHAWKRVESNRTSMQHDVFLSSVT